MPRYIVRSESQTDGHYRLTSLVAKDRDEAKAIVENHEQKVVNYQFDGKLDDATPGQRHAHDQSKPYKVTSVTAQKG